MLSINLNQNEKIFTKSYPYKIEFIGAVVREITPKKIKKYSKKNVLHIYFKTHGTVYDLTQTTEINPHENRCRVNLTPISKSIIPKPKESTQYYIVTNYYFPFSDNVVLKSKEFKNYVIHKADLDVFEISLMGSDKCITLNNDKLQKASAIELSFELEKALQN